MAREFENCVTMYGSREEIYKAKEKLDQICKTIMTKDQSCPQVVHTWKLGLDFSIVRLEGFQTEEWVSPNTHLSELSKKFPDLVFEWCHYSDSDDFCCRVCEKGLTLAVYETLVSPGDKDFSEVYYYLEAQRLSNLELGGGLRILSSS